MVFVSIRESVDSLCRDGTDTPYMYTKVGTKRVSERGLT